MIRLLAHQTRYELLTFVRNRQGPFFTVALPVIFLVIFVGVFGNNRVGPEHVKASTYYVPGIAALGIISAAFTNLVISITAQRELGILKRRRATPVPAAILVAARALCALVIGVVVMTVVLAVGRVVYDVHLSSSALPAIVLSAAIGSLAFACLGYALSTAITSADAAQPVVLATTLPLYFISGVFIPSARLPSFLEHVAEVFPVQHLVAALHTGFVTGGQAGSIAWGDLGVIAAWGVAGLAVALARFQLVPSLRLDLKTNHRKGHTDMATVNTDTRTRPGRCPTHGEVTAQKTVPTFKFPFVIVFLVRRLIAALQPYRCPTCGEKAS